MSNGASIDKVHSTRRASRAAQCGLEVTQDVMTRHPKITMPHASDCRRVTRYQSAFCAQRNPTPAATLVRTEFGHFMLINTISAGMLF